VDEAKEGRRYNPEYGMSFSHTLLFPPWFNMATLQESPTWEVEQSPILRTLRRLM